ncbi:Glucoamylase/glycosyl hydrolase-related protein [Gaiella occulta]|uniref:Glucoamylase/glycosyl hydrolase-related protein n=1 Tax=Gaiella occulta TaxID=1002870 RepID=A0A7M2YY67_9ACTN|nr:glycoside hydrolase family 15 protein [Gaiella occulta]RDI74418.1 Glucoamylase/glycosyl hydrolase-related protein [Gaiella occulta]
MSAPSYPPIADYALLADCHASALVSRDGSVDWCAFQRFDARPVFSRLLDWGRGGYFRIAPHGTYAASRRYLPGTNVLETRFETAGGVLTVTDVLPVTERPGHPDHQLIRVVRCLSGSVHVAVEFEPRFDYGLTRPRLEIREDGLAFVYGGADALVLQCELALEHTDLSSCCAGTLLEEGEQAFVVLTYSLPHEVRVERLDLAGACARVDATVAFWERWSERIEYDGPYREEVLRSALVLKALTNAPTGAIAAAPTTSLPEEIGGERNWDYRYSWLRDSALALDALFALGYDEEAHAYMAWLRRTTAGRAEDLQIMYGLGGERFLPEVELTQLEGYRGSKPVRIGNAAAGQFQLDVYGELLDTACRYAERGGAVDDVFWQFLTEVGGEVSARWRLPDQGIWEIRGEPRHFTYSKVMAWVAFDRLVRIAEIGGRDGPLDTWRAERDAIRALVEAEGVDEATGAFTQSFGSPALDASNLMIPIVGFVPWDDPRARATFERISSELSRDGFVYRYVTDGVDGLSGGEATFAICSFWLVECLARAGEVERARELFERLLGFANDVGLLAEEIDPASGALLGNFPQAFSHLGLIQAAIALAQTSAGAGRR